MKQFICNKYTSKLKLNNARSLNNFYVIFLNETRGTGLHIKLTKYG